MKDETGGPAPRGGEISLLVSRIGGAAFWLLLLFSTYISWLPFNFALPAAVEELDWPFLWNLLTEHLRWGGRVDMVVNAAFFVVIGACGGAWLRVTPWRPVRLLLGGTCVLAVALAVSLANELGQVLLPARVPSAMDIVAQVLGSIFGLTLWSVFGRMWSRSVENAVAGASGMTRLDFLLNAYLLFHVLLCLYPFDVIISVDELAGKLRRGRIEWRPLVGIAPDAEIAVDSLVWMLMNIPLGVWATRWRMPDRRLRSASDSLGLGVLLVAGIEGLQVLIASRYTMLGHVLVGGVGVSLGIWLAHGLARRYRLATTSAPRTSWTWLAMTFLCFAVPATSLWWPFEFTRDTTLIRQQIEGIRWTPFESIQADSQRSAIQAPEKLVLLIPLGVCVGSLAQSFHTRWRWWFAGLTIFVVGVVLEFLQVAIPARLPSPTDSFLLILGGCLGVGATRWVWSTGTMNKIEVQQ